MRMPVIAIAAAALGCATFRSGQEAGPPGAGRVPDAALGLSKGSVFDVPVPPPVPANAARPGQAPPPPRAYPGAPPVIPHAIGDFLPIARENACLGCHGVKELKPGQATPVPGSHTLDPRRTPDRPAAEVEGAWWICTSCHVERTGAPPLVGNRFRP